MNDQVQIRGEVNVLVPVWDPDAEKRCIVCHQPSGGKAICGDQRCATELAKG